MCGRGGTGRRAGLRIQCRKAWRFDPSRPHQILYHKDCEEEEYLFCASLEIRAVGESLCCQAGKVALELSG